ncbi:unnamed protein product [Rotaria magnacalcarata]|uniref:Methyltransferase FkbM domain-containing protein n=2 Tax=Rotaria magnacalcarata TaxID=392030 RepID=A0A816X4T9_9BILA|nr:unnamed protein product [Rotaria magnacalcarata]
MLLSTVYLFRSGFSFSEWFFLRWISITDADIVVNLNAVTSDPFQCINTKLLLHKYRTTVCVHDAEKDTDVSGLIIKNGIWEETLVSIILRILSIHAQFAFFDIGANIGIYTMYATSSGCQNVIAVECFLPNIERIRRAIQIEKVQQQVVLVPRALYNKSNVYLSLRENIEKNIGSQRLNAEVNKNEKDPFIVQTMRFDDLLPVIRERNIQQAIIKIDIETSEHYLCETGEKVFNQINIPFVMMEWANIKKITVRADSILRFFRNRSYIPFNPETCQSEIDNDYRHWLTQDIFWIKKNYSHLCMLSLKNVKSL